MHAILSDYNVLLISASGTGVPGLDFRNEIILHDPTILIQQKTHFYTKMRWSI